MLLPLLIGLAATLSSGERELVVLEPEPCPSCPIYADVAATRGYADGVLDPETGERITVRTMAKRDLPASWRRQIEQLSDTDESTLRSVFDQSSLVVVYREADRIRAAGNIADSSNLWRARYPDSVMQPAAQGPYPALTLHPKAYYREYFAEHWNLEYFVLLARDPERRTPAKFLQAITPGAFPVPLASRNLLLWGSADTPRANARFISQRMIEIEDRVRAVFAGVHVVRLFGHGAVPGNDSAHELDGEIRFERAPLPAHQAADARTLVDLFAATRPGQHNLLVQVGHSGPYGAPLWGSLKPLSADDFAALVGMRGADTVMVSGACHGGQFARGVQCGFFAARPDVIASGCQLSAQAVARSDDYLRLFFASLDHDRARQADRNDDGRISFAEAHWFASLRIEHHELPFTSMDALADRYFDARPDALPARFKRADLDALRRFGDVDERTALDALAVGVPPGASVPLRDLAQQKRAYDDVLDDMLEASSAQRNATLALPYRLLLAQLARRLIYLSHDVDGEERRQIRACEGGGIEDFLH